MLKIYLGTGEPLESLHQCSDVGGKNLQQIASSTRCVVKDRCMLSCRFLYFSFEYLDTAADQV
jgi:hypothetical protein